MVAVTLVFAGDSARGTELAAPLRAAATPIMDTLGTVSGADLADIAGDPTSPTPALGYAALLDQIGRDETDAFLELAGPGVDTPLVSVEIRHLGGALCDFDPDPGCAGKLDSEGLLYSTAPVHRRPKTHSSRRKGKLPRAPRPSRGATRSSPSTSSARWRALSPPASSTAWRRSSGHVTLTACSCRTTLPTDLCRRAG